MPVANGTYSALPCQRLFPSAWERAAPVSALSIPDPSFQDTSTHHGARSHGPSTVERGWPGPVSSSGGLERASCDGMSPIITFFWGWGELSVSCSQFPMEILQSGKGLWTLGSPNPMTGLGAWHASIDLWINHYWKNGLFKIGFENVFQFLFSNNKHW